MKTILTGLTLSCIILNVQPQYYPQNGYYPQFANPNNIYFPERAGEPLPLSATPQPAEFQSDIVKEIFGNPTVRNDGVEIEKSNEISSTTVQHSGPSSKRTPVTASNAAPQFVPIRQSIPQVDSYGQVLQPQSVPNTGRYNTFLYAVTNFGLRLMKNLDTMVPGNVVISPYSITSLLSMLQQGSTGETQDQLTTALNMTAGTSAAQYSLISNDYKNRVSRNIFKSANNVFVSPSFSINTNFKKVAHEKYASDITPASFATPDRAADQINAWVAANTNNKIDKLFAADSFDQNTQMVLVNAIYFKGLWEVPFRVESTTSRDFHLSNGFVKRAQFMRMRRPIKAGVDPANNAKVVILPFEHNHYSLMVILPDQAQGITGLLNHLSGARLLSYQSFPVVETELELPKFSVRGDMNLQIALRNMGITKMFGPYADLSGLGTYQSNAPQISSAVHSAVLSIDEQGGTAAAATAFGAVALSYDEPAILFRADRPFVVMLMDSVSFVPLFMAKIENPSQPA